MFLRMRDMVGRGPSGKTIKASVQRPSKSGPRLVTSASPGNLLETQSLKSHPRLAESESLGVGPSKCSNKLSCF